MSAWVLGLLLSAGYLMQKKFQMEDKLGEKAAEWQKNAKPAEGGVTSAEVRQINATVHLPDKYQDVNAERLSSQQVREIGDGADRAFQQVQAYEASPVPQEIQGVYLVRDNFGV